MASESDSNAEYLFTMRVHGFYHYLLSPSGADLHSAAEPTLGGKLLYAGELDGDCRALIVAANIAGAASLCATSCPDAQKQAIRDGVIDFLVISLDEALRVLKNEIRKRETVAVCVAFPPQKLESEMLERGVLPDLLRPGADSSEHHRELHLRQPSPEVSDPMAAIALVVWSAATAPAQWLSKRDAIALDCLPPDAGAARRWVRLGPRYLGRLAKGMRLLTRDREFASTFIERVRAAFRAGEIRVPVEIGVSFPGGNDEHHFISNESALARDQQ